MEPSTKIYGGNILVSKGNTFALLKRAYIGLHDGVIVYIGPRLPSWAAKHNTIESEKLIIPGFTDAHVHSGMSYFNKFYRHTDVDNLREIAPFLEDKIPDSDLALGAYYLHEQLVKSGITSYTDLFRENWRTRAAIHASKLKATLAVEVDGGNDALIYERFLPKHHSINFYLTHAGHTNKYIEPAFSIRSEGTVPRNLVRHYNRELFYAPDDSCFHFQVGESSNKLDKCLKKNGLSEIELFRNLGFLKFLCAASHCNYLKESDLDIMRDCFVSAVVVPSTDYFFGTKKPDVKRMLEKGICIALGTDGFSLGTHDMFKEMRTAVREYGIDYVTALKMATYNGARSQGRFNCGKISKGFMGDFTILDIDARNAEDAARKIVEEGWYDRIEMVVVNGDPVYYQGNFYTVSVENNELFRQYSDLRAEKVFYDTCRVNSANLF